MLAAIFLTTAAWSQEEQAANDEAPEAEASIEEPEETEEIDETGLDEQVYDDLDDDFRPSEEISTDQSIAFPTDI
jgi:hypothetical protein